MAANQADELRALPSVEVLASSLEAPPGVAADAARMAIAERRERILAGDDFPAAAESLRHEALAHAERLSRGTLRPVINATGVVLHTNLGRAPLAPSAIASAAAVARGYSNLEYDLASGERGSRHAHVQAELRALSGAEAAIAVNNNAAAVLLALAATASGREVVVGRDQLIEIGGSFRIPEILAGSGATLVEVGTTNRTRIGDYAAVIGPETGALLRVHQSNFRTVGFTETPALAELCELGAARGVPVIDDVGSGALEAMGDEPVLARSVAAGAALTCCSADKLLGGPQAGIIVGDAEAIERCRTHPLARALRLDKLQLAALSATLRLHREGPESRGAGGRHDRGGAGRRGGARGGSSRGRRPPGRVIDSASRPGGGTLPTTLLPGPVCAVDPGSGTGGG